MYRLGGEDLHKLIQAKKLVPQKFQLSRFWIVPHPFKISEYAPEDVFTPIQISHPLPNFFEGN